MIHINVTCDQCHSHAQTFGFDADDETATDLKWAIEAQGWRLGINPGTSLTKTICPSCVSLNEATS